MLKRAALLTLCCLAPLAYQATAAVTLITTCPYVITQPGQYDLGRDLNCVHGITINVDHVELQFNRHTISCPDAFFPAVEVNASDVSVIGSGLVVGCGSAVYLRSGENNRVVNLAVYSCRRGIVVESDNNVVLSNILVRVAHEGIYVTGSNNIIRGNQCEQGGSAGIIVVSGRENLIQGNRAHDNSPDLSDLNAACGSDVWKANKFDTANQTCVK